MYQIVFLLEEVQEPVFANILVQVHGKILVVEFYFSKVVGLKDGPSPSKKIVLFVSIKAL